MYVSIAKIFILLTSANYGPIYLIDFTNTRANNPIFIQLATTVFSTKAAHTQHEHCISNYFYPVCYDH